MSSNIILDDRLILLNKPQGISSTHVGNKLKNNFKIKKSGHVGTLDLEATGLLLILTGKATRLQNYLLDFDKEYSGLIQLGMTSTTDDLYGDIITQQDISILKSEKKRLEYESKIKEYFSNPYTQTAPQVSAKKNNGIPAYKLHKEGKSVPVKKKQVSLSIINLAINETGVINYKVKVSSGFYVRSFARDIGEILGLGGLARTINRDSIGPFDISQSIYLSDLIELSQLDLNNECIISFNDIFSYLPYSTMMLKDDQEVAMFINGNKNLKISKPVNATNKIIVLDYRRNPLGIIKFESELFKYEFVNSIYRKNTCLFTRNDSTECLN